MTDKSFDKLINDKLKHLSSPVPDNMWNRIAAEKRERRPGFLWWKFAGVGAFVVVALATGFYFWMPKNPRDAIQGLLPGVNNNAVAENKPSGETASAAAPIATAQLSIKPLPYPENSAAADTQIRTHNAFRLRNGPVAKQIVSGKNAVATKYFSPQPILHSKRQGFSAKLPGNDLNATKNNNTSLPLQPESTGDIVSGGN